MTALDLPERHLSLLRCLLKTHVPDAEVWAYGSRVNGQSHQASDLDLVLRNPADLTHPQEHLHDLKKALSDSDIPILVDVLDWARLPEDFHAVIEEGYMVIQGSEHHGDTGGHGNSSGGMT